MQHHNERLRVTPIMPGTPGDVFTLVYEAQLSPVVKYVPGTSTSKKDHSYVSWLINLEIPFLELKDMI